MTHVFYKRIMTDDDRNEILSLANKIWTSNSWDSYLATNSNIFIIYYCKECNIKILKARRKHDNKSYNFYTIDTTIHNTFQERRPKIKNDKYTCDEWIIKNIID